MARRVWYKFTVPTLEAPLKNVGIPIPWRVYNLLVPMFLFLKVPLSSWSDFCAGKIQGSLRSRGGVGECHKRGKLLFSENAASLDVILKTFSFCAILLFFLFFLGGVAGGLVKISYCRFKKEREKKGEDDNVMPWWATFCPGSAQLH